MQAKAYLRSTREHLEAAETQLAPVGAPLMLTSKTVAGVLHPGELVEGHRGQGGRRGAQAGPAANRKGGPQGVVLMADGRWQGESLHTTREPGEEASQPRPHEEFCEAPGELMLQGGEHTGSPGVGGGDCSGAQHQMDLATESLTNTVGCRLVPMYQVTGLSVAVALQILLLMSILRMVLNTVIRAITITRVRSCRWWLMGAFWGVLLQVAVVSVQWEIAKRHAIGKAATCRGSAEAVHHDFRKNSKRSQWDENLVSDSLCCAGYFLLPNRE
jgi:hypothetical protein